MSLRTLSYYSKILAHWTLINNLKTVPPDVIKALLWGCILINWNSRCMDCTSHKHTHKLPYTDRSVVSLLVSKCTRLRLLVSQNLSRGACPLTPLGVCLWQPFAITSCASRNAWQLRDMCSWSSLLTIFRDMRFIQILIIAQIVSTGLVRSPEIFKL